MVNINFHRDTNIRKDVALCTINYEQQQRVLINGLKQRLQHSTSFGIEFSRQILPL